ncbi:hypothetical protein, partial [Paenibacillus nanchangensis]
LSCFKRPPKFGKAMLCSGRECCCNLELRTFLVGMVGRTTMTLTSELFFVNTSKSIEFVLLTQGSKPFFQLRKLSSLFKNPKSIKNSTDSGGLVSSGIVHGCKSGCIAEQHILPAWQSERSGGTSVGTKQGIYYFGVYGMDHESDYTLEITGNNIFPHQ